MTAKDIVGVFQDRSFYITITNFCMIDVSLPRHQKAGEIASFPQEIVHMKDVRPPFHSDAKATNMTVASTLYTTSSLQTVWKIGRTLDGQGER